MGYTPQKKRQKEGGFKAQDETKICRFQKLPNRAANYFHREKIKYAA